MTTQSNKKKGSYVCNKCNSKYGSQEALSQHLNSQVHKPLLPCPECNKKFSKQGALNDHLKSSVHRASFSCHQCVQKFGSQQALKEHSDSAHKSARACPECNQQFSSQAALDQHLNSPVHKSFPCRECDRSFASQKALRKHLLKDPIHKSSSIKSNDLESKSTRPVQNGFNAAGPSENGGASKSIKAEDSYVPLDAPPINAKTAELLEFLQATENVTRRDCTADREISEMKAKLFNPLTQAKEHDEDVNQQVLFSSLAWQRYNWDQLPQHGLLGQMLHAEADSHLFLNTQIPSSAFICGLQGSGKSHTLTCLLENYLIPNPVHGKLRHPCSALVFHYNNNSLHSSFRPSETAFMGHTDRDFVGLSAAHTVTVLVAPSNFHRLRDAYAQIPGLSVEPFKINASDLNVRNILTLMAVNQGSEPPLYIQGITRILREMAIESPEPFSYSRFKARLSKETFSREQRAPLEQRLNLLEQFLDESGQSPKLDLEPGTLAIIDLSCPFVDHNLACILFEISMSIYLESSSSIGKVVAMDEAHKFLTKGPGAESLTESVLTAIRTQRHLGLRCIVSTQEPTISPRIIDLSSIKIIHHFTSPDWYRSLARHVAITDKDAELTSTFREITDLRTGQALIFSSAGRAASQPDGWTQTENEDGRYRVQIRRKITWDAGRSVVNVPYR